jgi:cell division protein FtsB
MAAVDWFAPAPAEPAPLRAPRRGRPPRPAPLRARRRARRPLVRRRVGAHIVWMTLFAVLLAGVVAVNVAVLRARVEVTRLDQEQAQLEARNQALASQLSAASSAPRVEAEAHRLGLVEAPAADTSYLDLAPRHR